jgi:hypothetical protein
MENILMLQNIQSFPQSAPQGSGFFFRKLYYSLSVVLAFLLEIEIYCRLATMTHVARQTCSYLRSDVNAGRRKLS